MSLYLLSDKYFDDYCKGLNVNLAEALQRLNNIELDAKTFTFYTSVAVISSSRIEGEAMELDSYLQHKTQDIEYLPELVQKPNDLYDAYSYARQNHLSEMCFLKSHVLLSRHLLPEMWRGVYRRGEMLVLEHNTGRIQYEAAPAARVTTEIEKLWDDIIVLSEKYLGIEEVFYFASMIHLVFVNIHPFNDGNGRAGRLLEKWFLAEKLGEKAWLIPSEKYYYKHIDQYYANLARLGMFYEKLDYRKADGFLWMLKESVNS